MQFQIADITNNKKSGQEINITNVNAESRSHSAIIIRVVHSRGAPNTTMKLLVLPTCTYIST